MPWEQGQCQEILHLTVAERLYRRVFGRPFDAAVPAQIVIGAVAVSLRVALVVFDVVRHEIVERKPIVAGHEINASFLLPLFGPIDIWAGDKSVWDLGDGPVVAPHEATNVITKLPVPLFPRMSNKAADLIEARSVPRLGNQLCPSQYGIRLDVPDDGRVLHWPAHLITR